MTDHLYFLRKALDVAKRSMDKGNLPFGCILTGPDDIILLEGENTVVIDENMIAHCEIKIAGTCDPAHMLDVPAREVFDRGGREMMVLGPGRCWRRKPLFVIRKCAGRVNAKTSYLQEKRR